VLNDGIAGSKAPRDSGVEGRRSKIAGGIDAVHRAWGRVDHGILDTSRVQKTNALQCSLIESWFDFVWPPRLDVAVQPAGHLQRLSKCEVVTSLGSKRLYDACRGQPADGHWLDDAFGEIVAFVETRERVGMYDVVISPLETPHHDKVVAPESKSMTCRLRAQ